MGNRLKNDKIDDGKCCECVPEEATCMYAGKRISIGTVWNDGPCKQLECRADEASTSATRLIETKQACVDENLSCPLANQQRALLDGKCCSECITVNETTSTTTAISFASSTTKILTSTPELPVCPRPPCIRQRISSEILTLSVQLANVTTSSDDTLSRVCRSTKPVQRYQCEGSCDSSVQMDYSLGQLVKKCTCCQPITEENILTFICDDDEKVVKSIPNIASCSCQPCEKE
jgi:hypothetical protein